ncbi:MAG: hypothetical protein HDS13_06855 [Bacteroides sp.]|nr:hypothetical protein [Bacteroides sp.]
MTNLIRSYTILLSLLISGLFPLIATGKEVTKEKVTIVYEENADGTIKVQQVSNKSEKWIDLVIDGNKQSRVYPNTTISPNKIAKKSVQFDDLNGTGARFWRYKEPTIKVTEDKVVEDKAKPIEETTQSVPTTSVKPTEKKIAEAKKTIEPKQQPAKRNRKEISVTEQINRNSFFGQEAVNAYIQKCETFNKAIEASDNKRQFIIDNDLNGFLSASESELSQKKGEIPSIAQSIIASSKVSEASQSSIVNLVVETLNNRFNSREQAYKNLKTTVDSIPQEESATHHLKNNILNYIIVGVIILVLILWIIIAIIRKQKKSRPTSTPQKNAPLPAHVPTDDNQAIVVRRRTTSILKKQSLEGVIGNPAYLVINSADFTRDSAVRDIYIKNTCIKEVYNLYAEDLRNTDNPKEDGCMVLGRWVYDNVSHTYDISLETVILPGDDAVFKEYELNFGGKIKLRIADKLRKLRRETNLQYDLVCWIHSHPGLGVFFSNSDDTVQMQLKHSQHPNFLVAFVVDILTSDQEMGIFTFRKDGSMNSKGDLTKMYSLEEMYKWALESDKASFNPDNYYNILYRAKIKTPSCQGIELNNSSIIDLTQLVTESSATDLNGIIGWVIGTQLETGYKKEFVVSNIVKTADKPTTGVIGALMSVPHFSLPTIQRLLAGKGSRLSFVLVYSSKQMSLTAIPIINGQLTTDEELYSEETIDDLKIWTRRKR